MNERHQALDLKFLFAALGIHPHELSYYEMAFTHSSCNGLEGTRHEDYERLEFLGDSVIGMVVSELCFTYHPEMEQGDLSILKAQFIKSESEAHYALSLHLEKYIRVGFSFVAPLEGATNILEDVFESFIGALLLDQGRDFTYQFVRKIYESDIRQGGIVLEANPKSRLQEAMQASKKEAVTYALISSSGPAHAKSFTCGVYFEGTLLASGTGTSKKDAETEAAASALAKMDSLSLYEEMEDPTVAALYLDYHDKVYDPSFKKAGK